MNASPKDLLFITIDCLRPDGLGCYGGPAHTPHLDSLAAQGTRYRYAFAHGHFTKTAFAAIFSGAYPWQFGGSQSFQPSRPNFVERLQSHGYVTLGVNSNPWLSQHFGYQRGYSVYRDLSSIKPAAHSFPVVAINNLLGLFGGGLIYPPYPDAKTVTDAAIQVLERARSPFFVWLHYMDTHWPYFLSRPRLFGPWDRQNWMYNARLAHKSREHPDRVTAREQQALKSGYLQAVEYIDEQIGRLLTVISRETAILFTSDHGEAFGEHGSFFHQPALYMENIHVPLVLYDPDVRRAQVEKSPVRHIDIAPTLLDIAGVPAPDNLEGISLLTVDRRSPKDLEAVSAVEFRQERERLASLRKQGWTLITRFRHDTLEVLNSELYNHLEDPGETENLAGEYPGLLTGLLARAISLFKDSDERFSEMENEHLELDEELRNRLRWLGYLE
ncbi:MAG TPA: sulfatase [Anaerolineales bacterium]